MQRPPLPQHHHTITHLKITKKMQCDECTSVSTHNIANVTPPNPALGQHQLRHPQQGSWTCHCIQPGEEERYLKPEFFRCEKKHLVSEIYEHPLTDKYHHYHAALPLNLAPHCTAPRNRAGQLCCRVVSGHLLVSVDIGISCLIVLYLPRQRQSTGYF